MISFGIFAALLIAIALCFVLIPLWMKPKIVSNDDSEINIELAQKKLYALEMDLENKVISQAQYDLLKNELMLNLHRDLKQSNTVIPHENKGRWLAIPLSVFILLLAVAIYSIKGDLRVFDVNTPQTQIKGKPTAADISAMVEKLAQKMKTHPNDVEGWMMLARSYKTMERYAEAVDAWQKVRALKGDVPDVLVQLADAVAMKNGTLLGEPTELVAKALNVDANNEMGLWLYGLANAENKKFTEAIVFWKKLQTHYPPENEDFKSVQQLIDQANEALLKQKNE